ncbi:hypothetical protein G7046_g3843 [Stylonectria norvegica]|nr:hypothetical protein G7046_g3843 [Stylonectria norvegica]
MPLQLLPATEADAARAAAIENIAYGPSPMEDALFPGPFPPGTGDRVDSLVGQLRADPSCRWLKIVDPDLEGENMIAFAMWFIWETPRVGEPTPRRVYGPGTNAEGCRLFFGGMDRQRTDIMEGKPYAYLKLLHTDPEHQRRGAGSMLVKWGLAEADRLGIDAFLESSEAGRALYEKLGFGKVGELIVDLSPWGGPSELDCLMMVRPAGATPLA